MLSVGAIEIVTVDDPPDTAVVEVIQGWSGSAGYCGGRRLRSDSRDFLGRHAWCFFVAFFCTWCAMVTVLVALPAVMQAAGAWAGESTSAEARGSNIKRRSIAAQYSSAPTRPLSFRPRADTVRGRREGHPVVRAHEAPQPFQYHLYEAPSGRVGTLARAGAWDAKRRPSCATASLGCSS